MPPMRGRRGRVLHWDDVHAQFAQAAEARPIEAIDRDLEAMGYDAGKLRAAVRRLGGRRAGVRLAGERCDAPPDASGNLPRSSVAGGWPAKSAAAGALGMMLAGLLVLMTLHQTFLAPWLPPSIAKVDEDSMRLIAQRKYIEAEPLFRLALALEERSSGPDHPKVAVRLNNLAHLLQTANRLAEAESLMLRALAIDARHFVSDPLSVARDLNNVAQLLEANHRLEDAERPYRHALAIFETALGADHPYVATVLNNLAHLLQATDRVGEAESMMLRAVAIDTKHFGPDHLNVARDLSNLRLVRLARGDCGEHKRASVVRKTWLRPEHPDIAGDPGNPGQLLLLTKWSVTIQPLKTCAL